MIYIAYIIKPIKDFPSSALNLIVKYGSQLSWMPATSEAGRDRWSRGGRTFPPKLFVDINHISTSLRWILPPSVAVGFIGLVSHFLYPVEVSRRKHHHHPTMELLWLQCELLLSATEHRFLSKALAFQPWTALTTALRWYWWKGTLSRRLSLWLSCWHVSIHRSPDPSAVKVFLLWLHSGLSFLRWLNVMIIRLPQRFRTMVSPLLWCLWAADWAFWCESLCFCTVCILFVSS